LNGGNPAISIFCCVVALALVFLSWRKHTSLAQITVITAITTGASALEDFGPAAATVALMVGCINRP
jgi:hypothetical protein